MARNFFDERAVLILRIILVIVNVIALAFLSAAVATTQLFYTDGIGGFVDGFPLAAAVWSLIWVGITLALHFRGVKYHPAINLVFEFLSLGLAFGTVGNLLWWSATYGYYDSSDCYGYPRQSKCTRVKARFLRAAEIIGSTMILISGVLHILLFIKACRCTYIKCVEARQKRASFVELDDRIKHDPDLKT